MLSARVSVRAGGFRGMSSNGRRHTRVAVVTQHSPPKTHANHAKWSGNRQIEHEHARSSRPPRSARRGSRSPSARVLRCESRASRRRREREERRPRADEAEHQERRRQGELRAPDREEERHPGVEEEVEGDVEVAAEVGRPEPAGEAPSRPSATRLRAISARASGYSRKASAAHAPQPNRNPPTVTALAERPNRASRALTRSRPGSSTRRMRASNTGVELPRTRRLSRVERCGNRMMRCVSCSLFEQGLSSFLPRVELSLRNKPPAEDE